MKNLAVAAMLAGFVVLCGCENKQLVNCQAENSQLKAELDQAKAEVAAANEKVVKAETATADAKKKDQETQTKALEAIRTMLEKQQKVTNDLNASVKAKEGEIKTLQDQIAQMKAAGEKPAAPAQK
jgi:chromosome segregation ATPase